jgi:type VI secretion system protein ImpA
MPSQSVFNFDVLLAPLSPANPCGLDARRDTSPSAVYFALKDARATARALERQADSDEEAGVPVTHWQTAFDLAVGLLSRQAKDLEVTAWLIEASLRLHGFAGLRDGFRLAHALIERYWDTLFPLPDEEGVATRVSALSGLNGAGFEGTLIQAIRKVPLTEPSGTGPFAFWHYTLANRPVPPVQPGRPAPPPPTSIEEIKEAARKSSSAFRQDLRDDLEAARAAFRLLTQALDERCGEDAPPSSAIFNVIEDVATALDHLADGAGPIAPGNGASIPGDAIAEPAGADPAGTFGGPIRSREDAFRQLQQVAEYFRRSEPHSPVSYTLDDLVRRGRMSLPELLVELLPDQGARNIFLTAAGIRPRQE